MNDGDAGAGELKKNTRTSEGKKAELHMCTMLLWGGPRVPRRRVSFRQSFAPPRSAIMLLLGALGADASSPLQPRDSDVDSVPRKTRHSASFESRVFVIGPNKAGTTSLDEHFTAMGWRMCGCGARSR